MSERTLELYQRNLDIIRRRQTGETYRAIAESYDLSVPRVRMIVKYWVEKAKYARAVKVRYHSVKDDHAIRTAQYPTDGLPGDTVFVTTRCGLTTHDQALKEAKWVFQIISAVRNNVNDRSPKSLQTSGV